jgi:hypothetical protein
MLPRKLYELLPFIYIVTGVVFAVAIDSTVVMVSSMLLIVAGAAVLLMRRAFRQPGYMDNRTVEAGNAPRAKNVREGYVLRSGVDRRQREVDFWPALDDAGEAIQSDRRMGVERRASVV